MSHYLIAQAVELVSFGYKVSLAVKLNHHTELSVITQNMEDSSV